MPEKLHELQRLWLNEATKYNVLPLDDRFLERINADLAGRPQLVHGDSQLLFGGTGRLTENSVISIKNKSHSVTVELEIPEGGAEEDSSLSGSLGSLSAQARARTRTLGGIVFDLASIRVQLVEAAIDAVPQRAVLLLKSG